MTFLVEHLPPHVHVVLSTRADPDLPLARWRAAASWSRSAPSTCGSPPSEAAAYLDEADRGAAHRRAGARPSRTAPRAGSPPCSSPPSRCRDATTSQAFIAGFAGDDRYVFDYLVEEVLAHQPQPVRDFLLRSAVLDRLTGPLCDAVLGRDDAGAMLRTLERANLFLVALDDQREWYRYHQLFADVLRARLLGEQPDLVPVLHRAGQPLVRAARPRRRGGQARPGGGRRRPGRRAGRAGRAGDPAPAPGGDGARPGSTPCPTTPCGAARCSSVFAAALLLVAGDLAAVGAPARRRGGALAARRGGRQPAVGRDRGAAHPAGDDRHVPGVAGAGPRRRRRARRSTPGAPSTSPGPTTTSPAAGRPGSSASPPGRAAT